MNRNFLIALAVGCGFVAASTAQNYRKWDFTQWSAQTIANLVADAAESSVTGWSDIEKKADAGEGKVAPPETAGKCFWLQDANMSELKANGVTIAETEGLVFNPTYCGNRSLAIAIDYPSTSLGEYAGPQYLWLGGGSKSVVCFTIPKVRIGQKMTFVVESHKTSDARGIELYVGSIAADNKIGDSFTPKTQDTHTWEEWTLPEGATDNGDGTVDVIVYNTSGCHIYSIEIGDNTEIAKVAFLYGGSLSDDRAYQPLAASDKFELVPVEANGPFTLAGLQDYNAIVISSTLADADAISSLKDIRPFIPTLCLNPAIYEAWGTGTVTPVPTQFAIVNQPNNSLFRDIELIDDPDNEGVKVLHVTDAEQYPAVTLAGLFADDLVLATAMDSEAAAIHGHSLSRNAYIYLPFDQVAINHGADLALLRNALTLVSNTKAPVSQAPAPVISMEYKNQLTIVTLKSNVPGAEIFYTTDGSTPTDASTLYTEPIEITTAGVTVKAVARGEGYMLSEPSEQAIDLKVQAETPVISVNGATVTITTGMADATIYYNYSGANDTKKSSPYTEPIVLKKSRTVYAFVAAEGYLNSEVAQQEVTIDGSSLRTNILAHMDANKDEYFAKGDQNKSSTSYYFSWRKDKAAYSYWNTEEGVSEEIVTDPETGDESTVITYSVLNPEEEVDFENGWLIRSRGQLVIWEGLSAGSDIGDTSNRNPATVDDIDPDFPVTSNFLNLADKNTNPSDVSFPYNAYIVTKEKFKGPFDIVANIGNGNGSENTKFYIVLQTSKDGNQWDSQWKTVGDTVVIENGYRLYHNFTRSYNGGDEVYVRAYLAGGNSKAQFYDIYIANLPGEEPQSEISGDVNGDQSVDVADISAILSHMAGTTFYDKADVNQDGEVDVADISSVLTIMAGQ